MKKGSCSAVTLSLLLKEKGKPDSLLESELFVADKRSYVSLKKAAIEMRSHPTEAERIVWNMLRGSRVGYKFRRQHVIKSFIVDFVCFETRLIVEIDGPVHMRQRQADLERTDILQTLGYRVVRFTNDEVKTDIKSVIQEIQKCCESRKRSLSE